MILLFLVQGVKDFSGIAFALDSIIPVCNYMGHSMLEVAFIFACSGAD